MKATFPDLLELQRQLRFVGYDRLGLRFLDQLRNEVETAVEREKLEDSLFHAKPKRDREVTAEDGDPYGT